MPNGLYGMGFWPRTWIIPLELEELKEAIETSMNQWWSDGGSGRRKPQPMWIVKPEGGMQGDDIFFVDTSVAAAAFLPRHGPRCERCAHLLSDGYPLPIIRPAECLTTAADCF
jgi:hypothetical protein